MYESELSCALNCAHRAGMLQLNGQFHLSHIEIKADASPVTEIDKACESVIQQAVLGSFPNDGFLGEESGLHSGSSGRTWIVDPLDGTRPFIRGIPTFSTLIALEENGIPVVGVIHLPALKITCWAARTHGAYTNGNPIHVSATPLLSEALGSALGFVEHQDEICRMRLIQCMHQFNYHYGFMDAFSYVCLAEGKLDICVNLLDKPWDCAAAACIITEAGGRYSDIHGNASVHNGSIVLSNGLVHQEALEFFRK